MHLAIDPILPGVGSSNWQTNVSVSMADSLSGHTTEGTERILARPWLWARTFTDAALALAKEVSDPIPLAILLRWAARHGSVGRTFAKLVNINTAGKERRAVVPIRADAGDATCPTWLERCARNRALKMRAIILACRKLHYQVRYAKTEPISREVAEIIRTWLGRVALNGTNEVLGLDVIAIPCTTDTVQLHILAVFPPSDNIRPPTVTAAGTNVMLVFNNIVDWTTMYSATYEMAWKLGPLAWAKAQLGCYVNGKRIRDRSTYGLFYGKQAEAIIQQAAAIARSTLSVELQASVHKLEQQIVWALDITKRAADVGDAIASRGAHDFAKSYAAECAGLLSDYMLVAESIRISTQFDFSGLQNLPTLAHVRDSFIKEIWNLPAAKLAQQPQWRCIEQVTVTCREDIRKLAEWMREV